MQKIKAPDKVSGWVGCFVVSKRQIETYSQIIPANTILKITDSGIRKYLVSEPCKCCGVKIIFVSKDTKDQFLRDFDFIEI